MVLQVKGSGLRYILWHLAFYGHSSFSHLIPYSVFITQINTATIIVDALSIPVQTLVVPCFSSH